MTDEGDAQIDRGSDRLETFSDSVFAANESVRSGGRPARKSRLAVWTEDLDLKRPGYAYEAGLSRLMGCRQSTEAVVRTCSPEVRVTEMATTV